MTSKKDSHIIRWGVIITSFIIVTLILWNTYDFFQKFKNEERTNMEILAQAYERMNSLTNLNADIALEGKIIGSNSNIPMIITDEKDSITTWSNLDSLKLIDAGQLSLLNDVRLETIDVEENDINYKLYVFVTEIGMPGPKKDDPTKVKGNPTEMDSIFVNRKGITLTNNNINSDPFDESNQTWWSLGRTFGLPGNAPSPIVAWVKGFPKFKGGENITNNGPITYQNTGKGYIFIPSGLAYPSINFQLGQSINPLFDQVIVFQIELLDIVEDTDHDNDGVASINEDADGDGDPTNDFSDTNNPNLPDYLNSNIK